MTLGSSAQSLTIAPLEIIALALQCRDAAATATPTALNLDPDYHPLNVHRAAQEVLDAGTQIRLFESPPVDALSRVMVSSTLREIVVRNSIYPHMLLDTLRGLFSDSHVNADCFAVLGFSGIDAVNVLEAIQALSLAELAQRFNRVAAARDASIPMILAWGTEFDHGSADSSGRSAISDLDHRAAAEEVLAAVRGLTTYIDESAVIDFRAVAEHASVPLETVSKVVDRFTLKGLCDVDEAMERFFHGDNPLRTAPIVVDADGRRMLVHDSLALPAVREVIETILKEKGRFTAYRTHRGDWVEATALDMLVGVLEGADVHRAFNYFIPDPKAAAPQVHPRILRSE